MKIANSLLPKNCHFGSLFIRTRRIFPLYPTSHRTILIILFPSNYSSLESEMQRPIGKNMKKAMRRSGHRSFKRMGVCLPIVLCISIAVSSIEANKCHVNRGVGKKGLSVERSPFGLASERSACTDGRIPLRPPRQRRRCRAPAVGEPDRPLPQPEGRSAGRRT